MHRQPILEVEYCKGKFKDVPLLPHTQNVDTSEIPTTTTQITVAQERVESNNQELRRSTCLSHAPKNF